MVNFRVFIVEGERGGVTHRDMRELAENDGVRDELLATLPLPNREIKKGRRIIIPGRDTTGASTRMIKNG